MSLGTRAALGLATAVVGASLGCGGGAPHPAAPAHQPSGAAPAVDHEAEAGLAVEVAINRLAPTVHRCWARAAVDDFRLGGRVTLAVTVGEGGVASEVAIVDDAARDPVLAACLVEVWKASTWPAVFSPGDSIQVPLIFVAPDAQYVIATGDVPAHGFGDASRAQVLLDEASTGSSAASLALIELEPGYRVELHRHTSAEVIFVLAGAGKVLELGGPGRSRPLAPGTALYVPAGVPHGLEIDAGAPMQALIAWGPGGPEAALEGRAEVGTSALSVREAARRPRRPHGTYLASAATTAALPIGGGRGEVRILHGKTAGRDSVFAVDALTAGPGMVVPPHVHDASTEVVYVLEGRGVMTIAGDAREVSAGDAIQIPAGVEHGLAVTGDGALKALQLYTPAGPEQRFRATPAAPAGSPP